jgi:metallo-beta-lactamase class B
MSFARLENLPCDILLSPHPGFTGLFEAMEQRQSGGGTDSLVDPDACRRYVDSMRDWLARRLAEESAQ